jgi:ABC-type sulfate transport system substrate-binding protein
MTNILNTLAKQAANFVPSNPAQYLALQLAKRLSDESALRHYLVLFEHHPEDLLLRVYDKCASQEKLSGPDFMRTFRELTLQES